MWEGTGIIRRIDELGRIAIPKEVRRQARIGEDDLLEIFVEKADGRVQVVLRKYPPKRGEEDIQEG